MPTVPARQSNRDSLIIVSIDVDLVCLSVWRCTPPVGRRATDSPENKAKLQQLPLWRDVVSTEASPQGCDWHRSCKQVVNCQSLTRLSEKMYPAPSGRAAFAADIWKYCPWNLESLKNPRNIDCPGRNGSESFWTCRNLISGLGNLSQSTSAVLLETVFLLLLVASVNWIFCHSPDTSSLKGQRYVDLRRLCVGRIGTVVS